MTFALDIDVDIKKARMSLSAYGVEVDKAARRAINRTADTVKTHARRTISKEIGLPSKIVGQHIIVKKARKYLYAEVVGTGKGVPLEQFKVKETGTGLTVKALGETLEIKSGFKRKNKPGYWKRVPDLAKESGLVGRTPIRRLYGPSIPSIMIREAVMRVLEEVARTVWPKNFKHEIEYQISKMK